jgi:CheY-like chemotaxis protein
MDQPKFRVLIVDDDQTIRDLLAEAMSEEGFEAVTAANGIEALARIELAKPNLLLLDIQMPKMDGRTFLQVLAKSGLRIPVIVMSAAVSPRTVARELTVDGYLAKPFDLEQVLHHVEQIFAQRSDAKRSIVASGLKERGSEGALAHNRGP